MTELSSLKNLINPNPAFVLANLSNISSYIYNYVENINWSGFYLWNEAEQKLILGPFCGLPACTQIEKGKGVCGTALLKQEPLRVADVHKFEGHIVCDSQSRSELVIPLIYQGQDIGVLDLDSPLVNRFGDKEKLLFQELCQSLLKANGEVLVRLVTTQLG